MSEIGDLFAGLKDLKREAKRLNKEYADALLKEHNVVFTVHNNGEHLIVHGSKCLIDFWPGPGRWQARNGKKGWQANRLIKAINRGEI